MATRRTSWLPKVLKWGAIAFAAFVVIGLLFDKVLLPAYVHGDVVTVPRVETMSQEAAYQALTAAGLEPEVSETRANERAPIGVVIQQNPVANAKVKEGRRVYLVVSSGERSLVVMPSLVGRSERDAKLAIESAGLKLGAIEQAPSTNPPGTVTAQSIGPATQVEKGTAVDLTLSAGPAYAEVTVPNLLNLPVSEAQRLASEAGLAVGTITYQTSNDLLPNIVIGQEPPADAIVNPGSAVQLTVTGEGATPGFPTLEGGGD